MQTLIFPLDRWNKGDAHAWAKRNGFASTKIDTTGGSHRFRQREPGDFVRGSFRTITLSEREDVQAVVGCPKPGRESDARRDEAEEYDVIRQGWTDRVVGTFKSKSAADRERNRLQAIADEQFRTGRINYDVPDYVVRAKLSSGLRRDVSRYDLSPAGKRWLGTYQSEGNTPETRAEYERLSRFDRAAIQHLLSENGNGERDILTTRKREKLRATQFALPESRSLPIHDAAHARNAAARLEQMRRRGTVTQNEYRRARAAIRRAERRFGIQPRERR